MKVLKLLAILGSGLVFMSCSVSKNQVSEALSSTEVPETWVCQYYDEKDDSNMTNILMGITDGDGDGEYMLNVRVWQKVNQKEGYTYDGHLYKYDRDGVILVHRGNNHFTSPRGTISLTVKKVVDEERYVSYQGTFTSLKYKIHALDEFTCTWNGQE